jgi:hypothetical protein
MVQQKLDLLVLDLWVNNNISVATVQMVYGFGLWMEATLQICFCGEMRIFDFAANGS